MGRATCAETGKLSWVRGQYTMCQMLLLPLCTLVIRSLLHRSVWCRLPFSVQALLPMDIFVILRLSGMKSPLLFVFSRHDSTNRIFFAHSYVLESGLMLWICL